MESTATSQSFKNFLFFWSGQLFSLLGSTIVQFVIIWWITIETKDLTIISVAAFFSFLPQFIFGPLAKLMGITTLFMLSSLLNILFIAIVWLFSNVRNTNYERVYGLDENNNN